MKHIEEDFERLSEMDKMYLMEKEQEMIHEWQQWEEEQEKLPAKIIITIKEKNNVQRKTDKTFFREGK